MSNKLKKDILCDNFTFMPVMSGAPRQGGHISHQTTTFQPFKFSDVIQNKYFQSENNMEDILTENSEVHYKFQSLPHSVIAHGWIPFVVSDFILFFWRKYLVFFPGGHSPLPDIQCFVRYLVQVWQTSPKSSWNLHSCRTWWDKRKRYRKYFMFYILQVYSSVCWLQFLFQWTSFWYLIWRIMMVSYEM